MQSTRTCSVEGCDKKHDSKGLCGMHALRARRGKPLEQDRATRPELFERNISRDHDGCWRWTGKVGRNGYGVFSSDYFLAHRYAYSLWVGNIPAGMQIDHLCMVKCCVNPSHLEVVTAAENLRRRDVTYGICSAVTHCPAGHPYDEANTYRHPSGRRCCRECSRLRSKARRAKTKESHEKPL